MMGDGPCPKLAVGSTNFCSAHGGGPRCKEIINEETKETCGQSAHSGNGKKGSMHRPRRRTSPQGDHQRGNQRDVRAGCAVWQRQKGSMHRPRRRTSLQGDHQRGNQRDVRADCAVWQRQKGSMHRPRRRTSLQGDHQRGNQRDVRAGVQYGNGKKDRCITHGGGNRCEACCISLSHPNWAQLKHNGKWICTSRARRYCEDAKDDKEKYKELMGKFGFMGRPFLFEQKMLSSTASYATSPSFLKLGKSSSSNGRFLIPRRFTRASKSKLSPCHDRTSFTFQPSSLFASTLKSMRTSGTKRTKDVYFSSTTMLLRSPTNAPTCSGFACTSTDRILWSEDTSRTMGTFSTSYRSGGYIS